MENNVDKQYQALLQDILNNGIEKKDRTGTGTLSVFGRQLRFNDIEHHFPILTTKKMPFKTIVTELLWFLRGDTNIQYLVQNGCHIWDGDAYKNFVNKVDSIWQKSAVGDLDDMIYDGLLIDGTDENGKWFARIPTKEEFIGRIKSDVEFAKIWGELGPIYGSQWRSWRVGKGIETTLKTEDGETIYEAGSMYIDQIQNLIKELKTNPDSRRLMVSAWNPGELDQMVLPPCHYGFQVYTRELSNKERYRIWFNRNYETGMEFNDELIPDFDDKYYESTPTRAISLMWNQRSVDTFLGLPFNIASYGLLLKIIAKEVNMVPDELIGNLGDVHLYSNHIEQAKEQIWRTAYELPKVEITERNWYQHQLVKERLGEKTLDEKILSYRPDCFELIGYESHPKIKAPLSN
jgi:thymidylate synthase